MTKNEVSTRVKELESFWTSRNRKMKEWYEQIQMVDILAQRDMESFVSNDPRSNYNLIVSLLNQKIPHRFPSELLAPEEIVPSAEFSVILERIWEEIFYWYRQRGQNLKRQIIKFMLATGYYATIAIPSNDGSEVFVEALNPATVYPSWDTRLEDCARVYSPGKQALERLALRNGWALPKNVGANSKVKDYWYLEYSGQNFLVHNSIQIDEADVKPDTVIPFLTNRRIPIFIAPVGGLPDEGYLSKKVNRWREELGQSVIATNENVYKSTNRWWTFLMQLLRDTAQPRTYERTNSAQQLVKPEQWYRRGAHFKIGLQDEIGYITPPPIPVELRSTQLDLEAMEQRGGPSWQMFGATQQRLTAYAMAQVAANTNQVASPFHEGVIELFTDMDTFIYGLMKDFKYKPYGFALPKGLPDNLRLTAAYELKIPGDIIQRATTTRMLNPEFELSEERVMSELFPEIKNPLEEQSKVNAGKARRHPVYIQLALIDFLRSEATLLNDAKDFTAAETFTRVAENLESQLVGVQEQPSSQGRVPVRPEVRPPQEPREPKVLGER